MGIRPNTKFIERHVNICSNYGGLGDMIARLPAFKYMKHCYPHVISTVYWHEYVLPLVELFLPSDFQMQHKGLKEMEWADDTLPLISFNPDRLTSLSLHLTDQAFLILMDRLPEVWHRRYLKKQLPLPAKFSDSLSKPYVVLTYGYTAPAREWKAEYINDTAKKLIELGYLPVFMGDTRPMRVGNGNKITANFSGAVDVSLGVDLINKTNLVEALAVLGNAKAVMGVDNGLLHLTSCTETPVIWGFTSVSPHKRLPDEEPKHRHIFPEDLSCAGCQSQCFLVKHDFKECMFKDYACLSYMTSDKFIEALQEVLNV